MTQKKVAMLEEINFRQILINKKQKESPAGINKGSEAQNTPKGQTSIVESTPGGLDDFLTPKSNIGLNFDRAKSLGFSLNSPYGQFLQTNPFAKI
mmetsp:Transcript_27609/g.41898  ORF Transcript_27609/g.41898 Transcript_27609/m.41898 type:complete len:95 (-) Transcript_27609:804-1088(-)|eukprot:CAMPEP_0170511082 /NCGR_PEP_ID=MMETSP0208-20121228/66110_1 /TAXON_ID=197538 /ORGANISM="Strombidium inclinatum, Strain S3" /LENGTH=94 /DNA_ID=CAMNT_0010794587 /DNA_START=599 /DNA_END=883 /DNA_ORIENTATION=+